MAPPENPENGYFEKEQYQNAHKNIYHDVQQEEKLTHSVETFLRDPHLEEPHPEGEQIVKVESWKPEQTTLSQTTEQEQKENTEKENIEEETDKKKDKQPQSLVLEDAVIEAISTVYDPEIPVNVYELGLIYAIDLHDDGRVCVEMTLTAPNCPSAQELPAQIKEAVDQVPGVCETQVDIVWDPPWDVSRMSDEARLALNMF